MTSSSKNNWNLSNRLYQPWHHPSKNSTWPYLYEIPAHFIHEINTISYDVSDVNLSPPPHLNEIPPPKKRLIRSLLYYSWPYGRFRCTTVWGYAVFLRFFVDQLLVFKWSQDQSNFFQEEVILLHDYGNSWITEERNFSKDAMWPWPWLNLYNY